jgi:hypothetical protein
MDDETAFERQLAKGMQGLMGPSEPVDDAAILAVITSTPSPKWSAHAMFGVVKFVGAAVIVVLVGGLALDGVLLTQTDDGSLPVGASPSSDPQATSQDEGLQPTMGTDIPAGAESGVIATLLGPVRWVHLSGDASSLPMGLPFADGGKFVALEEGYDDEGTDTGPRRWTSPDGLHWMSEPLAIPVSTNSARFTVDGVWSWLTTFGPGSLWRSADDVTWESIDLSGVEPAGPPRLAWDVEISNVASAGSLTAVEVTFTAREPSPDWPSDPSRVTELEPGLFSIAPRLPEGTPRLLRFEETPPGVRLIEEGDGTELAMLDGFTLDFAREWVLNGPPVERLVGRVVGDQVVPIAGPGPVISEAEITMVGASEGIIALALADPRGPGVAWRLDDRGWTRLGEWDITDPGPGGSFGVGSAKERLHSDVAGGGLFAVYDGAGTSVRKGWRSSDGVHWEQALDSWPKGGLMAIRTGYLGLQWDPQRGRGTWWASTAGISWIPQDLSPTGLTPDRWSEGEEGDPSWLLGVVGDTAFIFLDDRAGNRDVWVLGFEAPG